MRAFFLVVGLLRSRILNESEKRWWSSSTASSEYARRGHASDGAGDHGACCPQRVGVMGQWGRSCETGVLGAIAGGLYAHAGSFSFAFVVVSASVASADRIDDRDAEIRRILADSGLVGDAARTCFEFAELSVVAGEPCDARAQLALWRIGLGIERAPHHRRHHHHARRHCQLIRSFRQHHLCLPIPTRSQTRRTRLWVGYHRLGVQSIADSRSCVAPGIRYTFRHAPRGRVRCRRFDMLIPSDRAITFRVYELRLCYRHSGTP